MNLTADQRAAIAAGADLEDVLTKSQLEAMEKGGNGDMATSQRGADGGLSGGVSGGKEMGKAKAQKADDEDEDDMGDDEDEGEEDEEKAKKSVDAEIIEGEDLIKALQTLEATVHGIGGSTDRRAELAKGLQSGTLSDEEQDELMSLLKGGDDGDDDEDLDKSFAEQFGDDEDLSEAAELDVTGFLDSITSRITKSLDGLRSEQRRRSEQTQAFNKSMASTLGELGRYALEQGSLIKSQQATISALNRRLGIVESTPLPRKARTSTGAKPLKKSGVGEELSRDDILEGLGKLMLKSSENGHYAPCGEPVDRAVALYESSGKITRGMLQDVANVLGREFDVSAI